MAGDAARADGASEIAPVRVRFWGVRGSIPTPGPDTLRYGGNTSCVTVEGPGSELFIFDAGSGIRQLGLALLRERRLPVTAHLCLTHLHWDHIQGLPFFVPAFIPGNRLVVHAGRGSDHAVREALAGQMSQPYFPVPLDYLGADLTFQDIAAGAHAFGGARIVTAPLNHPGGANGYRIELGGCVVAYVTDAEPPGGVNDLTPEPSAVALARGADLLIHDAQYSDAEYPTKVTWGHSPIGYVVDVALAAGVKRLSLFHHDPTRADAQIDELVAAARARVAEAGADLYVDAAAEGQVIELVPAPVGASALALAVAP